MVQALPSEDLAAVCDLTHDISTLESYLQIKEALFSYFTASPLQQCFKLLDLPPLNNRNHSLRCRPCFPPVANIGTFNTMCLCRLIEPVQTTIADRSELAAATDLMRRHLAFPLLGATATSCQAILS